MQQAQLSYAEGSYIMMYLYSKGLLRKWYEVYMDSFKDDPSGGKALEAVLGEKLMRSTRILRPISRPCRPS